MIPPLTLSRLQHAGLVPGVRLANQHILDMVTMRNCVAIEVEGGKGGSAAGGSASGNGAAAAAEAAEAAEAQARAAVLEARGIPLSGSLSSLDMDDAATAAADGGSSGASGSSSRASRPATYTNRLRKSQVRAQSEGLDWRQALLAYAQLGGTRGSASKAPRQAAGGAENAAPTHHQQQQQQQTAAGPGGKASAAAAGQQADGLAGSAAQQGPAAAQQSPPERHPRLVGTDKHTLGVPWARAWSEFQRAAPQRHAWVTYRCSHAVFGHDARR